MKPLCFLLFVPFFIFISSCTLEITNPLENAYSGITETSETDPTPIGKVDPNDWQIQIKGQEAAGPAEIPIGFSFSAFPNPTVDYISFQFAIPSTSSVRIFISDKPGSIIDTLVNDTLSTGYHLVTYDARGLKSRIYRAYFWTKSDDGKEYFSYGDFMKK